MKLLRNKAFEQRFVAFVDILGFRDIVRRMTTEPGLFTAVRDVLKTLDRQSEQFRAYRRDAQERHAAIVANGRMPLIRPTHLQMTAFSDCYVVSERFPAWHVVAAVQALGSRLLGRGILCRGGVVEGLVYHSGRVVFGPAMVEAYELESQVARYPRILVSEAVREAARGYHEGVCQGRLFIEDLDGCNFINIFEPPFSHWKALSEDAPTVDTATFLRKVRPRLAELLTASGIGQRELSKVRWAIHYFNMAAERAGVRPVRAGQESEAAVFHDAAPIRARVRHLPSGAPVN